MSKPRFELVVRIVKENPDKPEEPTPYRDVLAEVAVPVMTEWNTRAPEELTPEALMAMTETQVQERMCLPIIDQMHKAPINMMVVQCLQKFHEQVRKSRKQALPTSDAP